MSVFTLIRDHLFAQLLLWDILLILNHIKSNQIIYLLSSSEINTCWQCMKPVSRTARLLTRNTNIWRGTYT